MAGLGGVAGSGLAGRLTGEAPIAATDVIAALPEAIRRVREPH
jgi:hypothetical protein